VDRKVGESFISEPKLKESFRAGPRVGGEEANFLN